MQRDGMSFMSYDYTSICKPYKKQLPKDLHKIYQLFVRIRDNDYFGKYIKI